MNRHVDMAPDWLGGMILAALMLSAYVCTWLIARWRRGVPPLPYSRRRQVPWNGGDVLMVVLIYIVTVGLAGQMVALLFGRPPEMPTVEQAEAVNPIIPLVRTGTGWMLAVGFLAAVVVAPIVEEFLFRVVLQGWLEAVERRWRRALPMLRRAPLALGPILLTSFLFAMMHFRTAGPEMPQEYIVASLIAGMAAGLTTVGFAVALLMLRAGATAADLGWAPRKLLGDLRIGLVAFVAVVGPLYGLFIALQQWIPKSVSADPIPLFFFAMLLGVLYHRTRRMAPSVALHVALNLTSLVLLLAAG